MNVEQEEPLRFADANGHTVCTRAFFESVSRDDCNPNPTICICTRVLRARHRDRHLGQAAKVQPELFAA